MIVNDTGVDRSWRKVHVHDFEPAVSSLAAKQFELQQEDETELSIRRNKKQTNKQTNWLTEVKKERIFLRRKNVINEFSAKLNPSLWKQRTGKLTVTKSTSSVKKQNRPHSAFSRTAGTTGWWVKKSGWHPPPYKKSCIRSAENQRFHLESCPSSATPGDCEEEEETRDEKESK